MTDVDDLSEQRLDELLRKQFQGAVTDDGFSARVMHALPPRRQSRHWLLPISAAAGSLMAWLALMPSPIWQHVAHEWLAGDFGAATVGIGALLFGVTIVSCTWSLEEN